MTKVRPKAKPLTPDQWAEMCTRYELGGGIREIARDFGCDPGNLAKRFKKDGIVQNALQDVVTEKATETIRELQNFIPDTTEITTITTDPQKKLLRTAINTKLASWLSIAEDTTDEAFKLNQQLLGEVKKLSQPGVKDGYKPHEATQVLRSIVSTHGMLLEQTGISAVPDSGKGNSKHSELASADNAQDASRAYQELINGSK